MSDDSLEQPSPLRSVPSSGSGDATMTDDHPKRETNVHQGNHRLHNIMWVIAVLVEVLEPSA